MAEPLDSETQSDIRLIYLLPNMITIAAICAGLTAIRFGYEGNFEMAVRLILAACVLDGLDGRVARLLKRSTAVGAELDSLADFVNFGVAPVLILHSCAFQDFRNAGWIAVLFYAVCCVLRLARFNVIYLSWVIVVIRYRNRTRRIRRVHIMVNSIVRVQFDVWRYEVINNVVDRVTIFICFVTARVLSIVNDWVSSTLLVINNTVKTRITI